MKKHLLIGLFLIVTVAFSQTNPTPQNLPFSLNFGMQSFSAMPSGTAVWTVSSSPKGSQSTAESSVANNNATLTATTATQTTGGAYGLCRKFKWKIFTFKHLQTALMGLTNLHLQ